MEIAAIALLCCLGLAQPALPLDVILHDSAGVAADDLANTRGQIEAIFLDAGIAVTWRTARRSTEASDPFQVTVLLRKQDAGWTPKRRPVMGVALASDARRGVTSVYYNSIAGVARTYSQPVVVLLAITIAHEIGHLLLPAPAHASEGIMRADWEGDDLRHAAMQPLGFTAEQAASMRMKISAAR
jgi:hypothetical protein